MKGQFTTKLEEIEQNIIKGNYKTALDQIDQIITHETISLEEIIQCNIFKARIYLIIFPFSKAIRYAEEAYEESKKIENKYLMFDSLLILRRAYYYPGKFDLISKKTKLALEILDSFEDKDSLEYLKRKALIPLLQGQRYNIDFSDIEDSMKIADNLGLNELKVDAYISLGSRNLWSGNLDEALKFAQKAVELSEKIKYHFGQSIALQQLDVIYCQKGELRLSKEHALKCLALYEPEERPPFLEACLLINLGTISRYERDIDKSLDYFRKASDLLIKYEVVKTYHYPVNLARINSVLLELDETEVVLQNLNEIENLYLTNKQHILKKIYHLSKAVFLKSTNKEPNIDEAILLLEEFADDSIAYLEFNSSIVFHLCELYLMKVIKFNDSNSYNKLRHRVITLNQMAAHENSHVLLAQALLLQSKMDLIDFKVENSRLLLEKAQKIADDKGITHLAKVISSEYDLLLDQLTRWEEMSTYLPSLEERFEFTHIEDLLTRLIRTNALYTDIREEKEQPYFFFIMNKTGFIIFSEKFSSTHLDSDLLQGIQKQINEFDSSFLSPDRMILRIKYQQYTIAVNPQENILLIYVFVGHSYSALQKLYTLEDEIYSFIQGWSKYYREFQSNQELSLEERMQISKSLEKAFVLSK